MKQTQDPPLRFVLITVFVLLLEAVINAMFSLGSIPLAVTIVALYIAYAIYGVVVKDHTIWVWLLFGFVTGLVELASNCDHYLVEDQKVLVYPEGLRMIGVSPSYLRFAWGLIFTVLGLVGLWIRNRRTSWVETALLIAAIGAVLIAVFENLARPSGWWYYRNTPMLVWSPYFVVIFEFLSTLVIVPVGWWISGRSVKSTYLWAIGAGVATGLWMCVAMRIGYWLVGPCSGAIFQIPCKTLNLPEGWGPLG